ncbi:hypothetical protein PV11_05537 [Exophiala sideris]|uniref:Uncharacterized protein n=1 Tax=Exophiala sideris TaxID=1016849 RepID=A0A0D1YL42_9EURO|nr:hypothetical protein PV11_05537 [Exophiala sideris]
MSRRSARLSAFAVVDNNGDNAEAEDVTDILNAEAGSKQQNSNSKRKQTTGGGPHVHTPIEKRLAREHPATASPHNASNNPTPVRSSGRLQARVRSSDQARPARTRNLYELPDELGNGGAQPESKPAKRMKVLKKPPQQLKGSPFKGRGELDTRTTAGVNLDDSPRKSPRRNPFQKIGKSMIQPRRNGRTRLAGAIWDELDAVPDESEIEAAHNAPLLGPTPVLAIRVAGKATKTPSKKKSPRRKASHEEAQRGGNEDSLSPEGGASPGAAPSIRANPLAQAAKHTQQSTLAIPDGTPKTQPAEQQEAAQQQAPNNEKAHYREPQDERDVESDVAEDVEDIPDGEGAEEAGDDTIGMTPQSPRQRPETDSQRRAREQQEREEEAERKETIDRELRGIEEAVLHYECESAWQEALLGAAKIVENRSSRQPTSEVGRGVYRVAQEVIKAYKELSQDNQVSQQSCDDQIKERLALLKRRCSHICSFRVKRPDLGHKSRAERRISDKQRFGMIRDIYEHLIPDLFKVMKHSLRARYRDHDLSRKARKELVSLMNITVLLVDSAGTWQPRPDIGNDIKPTTRSLKPHVLSIMNRYKDSIAAEGAEVYVDNLWEKQVADQEEKEAMLEQRRAEVRARHCAYATSSSHEQQPEVIDIDDFERESTEDIPAPATSQWTNDELETLLNALQKYTAESRFQDILDRYGGPDGKLSRFDMDQLVAEARWIKQSMAGHLRDCSGRSWDWLLSLPD